MVNIKLYLNITKHLCSNCSIAKYFPVGVVFDLTGLAGILCSGDWIQHMHYVYRKFHLLSSIGNDANWCRHIQNEKGNLGALCVLQQRVPTD